MPQLPPGAPPTPDAVVTPTETDSKGPRTLGSTETHVAEVMLGAILAVRAGEDSVIEEAVRCRAAGVTILELVGEVGDVASRIRARTDCILHTSMRGGKSVDERIAALSWRPDTVGISCGSQNIGDDVHVTTRPQIRELIKRARDLGAGVELECSDVAHVEEALVLASRGTVARPASIRFRIGTPGGIAATEANLRYLISLMPESGVGWGVEVLGSNQQPLTELALRLGGHVHCWSAEEPASVVAARAAAYARAIGRVPVDPTRARAILGSSRSSA
jgi:3-keto-5-aminohexanoate cleavage enzyme